MQQPPDLPKPALRFDKPKVLFVDLHATCLKAATEAGFNVSAGTFGKPYANKPTRDYVPVVSNIGRMPRQHEKLPW